MTELTGSTASLAQVEILKKRIERLEAALEPFAPTERLMQVTRGGAGSTQGHIIFMDELTRSLWSCGPIRLDDLREVYHVLGEQE